MRINQINIDQSIYKKRNFSGIKNKHSFNNFQSPNFKGNDGALAGMVGGAAFGAAVTAIVIATGGLAAIVGAIGTTSTLIGGTAAGTHVGGILGGLLDKDNTNNGNHKSK